MQIDMTLPVTPEMLKKAWQNTEKSLVGHLGTHFDIMDQTFPLTYTRRNGLLFDVTGVKDREITVADVDLDAVEADLFVAFYSGFTERVPYGTAAYFKEHPQLSFELINALIEKKISVIGLDFAGIRRGKEHVPADRQCAKNGVFVVENLWDLKKVAAAGGRFVAETYPLRWEKITGLPCRVIARIP